VLGRVLVDEVGGVVVVWLVHRSSLAAIACRTRWNSRTACGGCTGTAGSMTG
jgi:hypothetical protein